MTNKFRVGDIIVGNEKANYYNVTKKGWEGTVIKVHRGNEITVKDSDGEKYNVDAKCFDLFKRGKKVRIIKNPMKYSLRFIRKNKKVKSAMIEGRKIVIITKPLFHTRKNVLEKIEEYFIGIAKIVICKDGYVEVQSLSGLSKVFPHDLGDGEICWGNYRGLYDNFADSDPPNYEMLANLTINFIEDAWNYDHTTRLRPVKKWIREHK
jgi:hypothetical protein